MGTWRRPVCSRTARPRLFREQRTGRMNLQWLRQGTVRFAGLALVFSGVLGMAQVATHAQLSSVQNDHGATFTIKVSDISGSPATGGVVTLHNAQGASLGSAFV